MDKRETDRQTDTDRQTERERGGTHQSIPAKDNTTGGVRTTPNSFLALH